MSQVLKNTAVGSFLESKALSKREKEVTILVSTGMSNKEIADSLKVSEKTIKFHLANVFKKLEVPSRAKLIVLTLPLMLQAQPSEEVVREELSNAISN